MRTRTAGALSAVAHAILVVPIAMCDSAEEPRSADAPISIEVIDIVPEPPAVAVLEPQPAEPQRAPRTRATPAHATSTRPRAAASEAAPSTSASGSARTPWFDMRRRGGIDLRGPGSYAALAHVPRGPGQPEPAGDGTHRSDHGEFVANVARDGSVEIRDRPSFTIGRRLPTLKEIGVGVSDWYYSDKGPDGQRGKQTLVYMVGGSIDPGDRSGSVLIPIAGGKADLTGALMRATGSDPYASKKRKLLDTTRDERVAIGDRHRADQLRRTSEIIQWHLDRVARIPDPRARRDALFALWDEAIESGDAAHVEAGRAARLRILGVIRAHHATGSPDQYTADELAALNRRRQSKTPFAPYD